jgi:hypothetical protein
VNGLSKQGQCGTKFCRYRRIEPVDAIAIGDRERALDSHDGDLLVVVELQRKRVVHRTAAHAEFFER